MAPDGEYHAVKWIDRCVADLGTLGGRTSSALDVNGLGQIVGWAAGVAGHPRAFLHDNGEMVDLGALGGKESSARVINDAGVAVGRSWVAQGRHHTAIFRDGDVIDINAVVDDLLGFTLAEATDINAIGEIVGWGYQDGEPRPFKLVPW